MDRRSWLWLLLLSAIWGATYLLIKIAGALGVPLYAVGAQTAGMTLDQFMATRKGR